MDQDLLDKLDDLLSKKDKVITDASAAAAEAMKKLKEAAAAASQGAVGAAGGLTTAAINATSAVGKFAFNVGDLLASFNSITSSTYGLDKAFTSVIPTLDNYMKSMSKVLETVGSLGSGVSAFGFSMGKATEGLSKVAITGLDIVSNIIKFQLETSQKVADTYTELAKTGATFGGSINLMAMAAKDAGIPIQNFSKLIISNVELLSKFGKSYKDGAVFVGSMGNEILKTNSKLAVMYGGVDGLNQGIAEYIGLQSQLGIDETKDRVKTKEGVIEYLMRQKELAQITGKNAETLKKEEEGRRKQLDYNLKLGRLGDIAKENVKEGMAVAGKLFGDQGAKYAEEYFATGGKVISAEALRYQAMNQEAADAIAQMVTSVDQSRVSYREGVAANLKANAGSLEAFAKSQENLAEINRAANNPILKSMTETSSSVLENLNLMKNYSGILVEIEKDRATKPGAASEGYAAALNMAKDQQIELDKMVLTNMTTMSGLVKFLYDTQGKFITNQELLTEVFNSMAKGDLKDFGAVLEKVVMVMGKRFFGDLLTPVQPGTEVLPNVPLNPPGVTPADPNQNPMVHGAPSWGDIFRSFKGWLENPTVTVPTPVPVSIVNQPQTPASESPGQGGPLIPMPQIATLGTLLDQQTVEQHTALLTNMERNTADTNIALGRLLNAMS